MKYYYSFLIGRTFKKLKNEFQKVLIQSGYDITVDQWVVIFNIYNNKSLNQSELAHNTQKDPPTITRILDILLSKKYIEKSVGKNDRRKFDIKLSKKGYDMVEDIYPHLMSFRKKGWNKLSKEDYFELERILNQVFNNFES